MLYVVFLFAFLSISACDLQNVTFVNVTTPSQNLTFQVNDTIEYILQYDISSLEGPPRVWVHSKDAHTSAPLMIVARQSKELLSWQLPMVVEGDLGDKSFMTASRTLCNDVLKVRQTSGARKTNDDKLMLTVSTVSSINVGFTVHVESQENFRIQSSKWYNFQISPSEPRYFYYNFSTNLTSQSKYSNYETVILEVNSDDDICMTVGIQNVSCPVFDTDQDVTFRGFYETVNKRGGMTISKYNFPYGFYIVFVAKSDDFDCTRNPIIGSANSDRVKNIQIIVNPSITYKDYLAAVIITLSIIGAFYILFGSAFFYCSKRMSRPRQMEYVQDTDPPIPASKMTNIGNEALADTISVDETEYDVVNEIETDKEMRLCRGQPYLTDLARKDPRVLRRKSYLYLYNVLTIAVFYGLPVVQLVVAYQRVLNETGEQDLCYYNFLCAHPLGLISDFNHLFSNIGYILFGILFLIITWNRERTHRDINFDRHFGIPQHYGMFYAMGVALIMEGVLSGSYHVCPTQANFQFDSSFMYVMAVLCMVKLYQNRHPDINASAYITFGVLALAILLGMIGLFEGTVSFWIFFVIIYLLTCFYLSIKIYYMGCWRITRFVLLTLGNLCNWTLAFLALYYHPKNFAVFLLAVFMANTLLYFFFYIVMKYLNKEKVRVVTWIFLIFSTVCAVTAMYFFLQKGISWSRTPAESRQFNKKCIVFNFYDSHDVWHFLSATGMFFTFMVLLTLDDDLSHTHHSKIPVF